jgi:hypothetical protein
MAGVVPLRLKMRTQAMIKVMDRNLRPLESQSWGVRIGAYPRIMRCRIKSKFLDRFADFAFHGFCSPR